MDEKLLIKGEPYQTRKILKKIAIWWTIISVILVLMWPAIINTWYYIEEMNDPYHWRYCVYHGGCSWDYSSVVDAFLSTYAEMKPIHLLVWVIVALIITGCGLLIIWVIALLLRSGEITVTDKRVYGVCGSKRVDLPLDSISAVSFTGKAISVSTSSGCISFRMLKNAETVYDVINKLLLERQEQKKNAEPAPAAVVNVPTKAAELKEYKELLDSGIITPEEFDAKKKELLGL